MITTVTASAFDRYRAQAFPYQFRARLHLHTIAGGTPTDPKVAEGFIRTKLGETDEEAIRSMVAEIMVQREATMEEAAKIANDMKNLCGFKKDADGLYIEGRQVKAAIKEAAMVAVAADKVKQQGWGVTNKYLRGFLAEHVFVLEERIHLGVTEPTRINQSFLHKVGASGPIDAIQLNEIVEHADIEFTVTSDHEFSEKDWAMIWLTGERQGLGAARSQGFGLYTVTAWERL